ncbi:hypothetical protein [Streptomyces sp. NPDC048606]|uniref:hypothetical protein n=1 Tax=Streptomyces sp. NPDC048606 TaxID=3154726 RepID=UPI00342E2565
MSRPSRGRRQRPRTPLPEPRGTDAAALPAAGGLALLACGGWVLTTSRPWQKTGETLALGLEWVASGSLLLSGLVLLARCVRAVHGADPDTAPDTDG